MIVSLALARNSRMSRPRCNSLMTSSSRRPPTMMDTAIIIVGGLRELLVIALQRGRDMRELRASASETIKAILSGSKL